MANNLSSLLAYSSTLYEAPFCPPRPAESDSPKPLEITVVFTDVRHTLEALRKAGQLAHGLHAHIRLIVPQVVPYPLPLTTPPVMLEFTERRFRLIAAQQAATNHAVDMRVELYLCRDVNEMLDHALSPKSTVIVGGPKHWWTTTEQRLARRLRRKGHDVIFATPSHNDHFQKERVYA